MRFSKLAGGAALVLALAAAQAEAEPGISRPGFLPPDAQIVAAIEDHPSFLRAKSELGGAQAEAQSLEAGPYDTTLGGSVDRRHIRQVGEHGEFAEWSVEVSRPIRLTGQKATLDRAAGRNGVRAARDGLDDARHVLSLDLVESWMSWLEAEARLAVDRAELATYVREAAALRRRVALKDAAPLDLDEVQAAEARARAAVSQSEGRSSVARSNLSEMFPSLSLSAPPEIARPVAPIRAFDLWPDRIVTRSHEIGMARAVADRDRAKASRARLDRIPDPTVGIRAFNERGGTETGVGLFVSVPIGMARRSAEADRLSASAGAAEADYLRTIREVKRSAQREVIAARSGLETWKQADAALTATENAAHRLQRGFELGERSLTDLLFAQRQAFEARRSELSVRASAQTALLKLALDAHELWLDDEASGP